MVELVPYPFAALVRRMFHELAEKDSIFDLPKSKFWLGEESLDYSLTVHGKKAATPLGPAAGPQSQMAQNIVLAWLGGSRILELKTVQILDELEIPRPCIDMQTIGFNVEWSQELKLQESLEEYVKGAMLIEMLIHSGKLGMASGADEFLFDMSVGYNLEGIQSKPVDDFLHGMLDASAVVERFRSEIPDEFAEFRNLEYRTRLSDTLTLSTFHGCPSDEIERIAEHLMREVGLHTIVKLNPTLLGPERARELLHDQMGYASLVIPDTAFEQDTRWDQAQAFCQRLGETALEVGLGFGVKFTNTLIVENHRDFFPAEEKSMYLSGQPLHVLAMNLVRQFRQHNGDRWPISFSAGIDRKNFPDAVALGLVPVTVCTDLLRPGGYGRSVTYFKELAKRMSAVGANDLEEFTLLAYGCGEYALAELSEEAKKRCRTALAEQTDLRAAAGDEFAAWVSAAVLLNTEHYVEIATNDPRYHADQNAKIPKKIGSLLTLFDCITCDKCVPVCPNDANFTFQLEPATIPITKLMPGGGTFEARVEGAFELEQKHQIGNFADFCNECGNCDVFCPEDGGPYVLKPRFFSTPEVLRSEPNHDGFCIQKDAVHARCEGVEYTLEIGANGTRYSGEGFELELDATCSPESATGTASCEVDLTWALIMRELHESLLVNGEATWIRALAN